MKNSVLIILLSVVVVFIFTAIFIAVVRISPTPRGWFLWFCLFFGIFLLMGVSG